MPLAEDQHVVQALAAQCSCEPPAYEFALGDRTGVLITPRAVPAKTSSNSLVNLLSCGCQKPMPPGDTHESRRRRGHVAEPGSDQGR